MIFGLELKIFNTSITCASWSDRPLITGYTLKIVSISININIIVAILVGKVTVPKRLKEAKRDPSWLVLSHASK